MKIGQYIEIIKRVAITDLKLRYQGSVAGYLWTLMKPLFLFSVMYFVFTKFLKIGGNLPYYTVYLLLGIVLWSFFSEVTSICMGSIVNKGDLIKKVYFPRILLVFANSLSSFFVFLLNLIVVFAFMFFNKIDIHISALLLPLLLLELYIFSLGVSLLLASLYVKFRDISHIWEVLLQALFYGTPILYPLSLVPIQFAKYMMLNPVAQVIQDSRYILITTQTERANSVLGVYSFIPYVIPFLILPIGYFVFQKMSVKFAEEI